ncbi:unnamed protein product [Vicia faba]|uniref:Uncharacterized protein n=1 Tax=Vicia faba TaxID=3906 RepID=A0AAV1AIQ2_VICFA|nr:unnamed protein product [Vicia faba]
MSQNHLMPELALKRISRLWSVYNIFETKLLGSYLSSLSPIPLVHFKFEQLASSTLLTIEVKYKKDYIEDPILSLENNVGSNEKDEECEVQKKDNLDNLNSVENNNLDDLKNGVKGDTEGIDQEDSCEGVNLEGTIQGEDVTLEGTTEGEDAIMNIILTGNTDYMVCEQESVVLNGTYCLARVQEDAVVKGIICNQEEDKGLECNQKDGGGSEDSSSNVNFED